MEGLAERYEELRAYAVGAVPGSVPRGLALLVRRGVSAWVQGWASCAPACRAPTEPAAGGVSTTGTRTQAELVMALVTMALSCRGR